MRLVLPLLLLAACSKPASPEALAAAAEDDPNVVTLAWGWEPGWQAVVGVRMERTVEAGDLHRSQQQAGSETFATEPRDDGGLTLARTLTTLGTPTITQDGEPVEASSSERALAEVMTGWTQHARIAPGGIWQGLEQTDAARDRIAEAAAVQVDTMVAEAPAELQDAVRAQVTRAFDPDRILAAEEARGALTWFDLVAFWKGAQLDLGANYETRYDAPIVAMGMDLGDHDQLARFTAEARVPCTAGGDPEGCVRLVTITEPDAQGLSDAFYNAAVQLTGRPGPEIDAALEAESAEEGFRWTRTITLVTEPDTLRPWRLEETVETALELPASLGGMTRKGEKTTVRTWVWVQ